MTLPELYISRPGVAFPNTRIDNAEVLRRVREQFKGPAADWPNLEAAIQKVFGVCQTNVRYLEEDYDARVAGYAAAAAEDCLEKNAFDISNVDLVIHGSIARQYFEPATAMEVAARLGLQRTHAFDVTAACVGHLEAIQAAAAYLALHDRYRTALVCTAELFRQFLDYDIQSVKDLYMKSAGLTVGNAAACVLVSKSAFARGCIRLESIETYTVPDHWHLCQAPIDGKFASSSIELMRLGRLIPPWLTSVLAKAGWNAESVDHYVFHQPSVMMVRKIIADTGGDPDRGIYTHPLYGNTASASVGVTYNQLLQERTLKPGDKLLLGSAAAGFSVVAATGTWQGGNAAH